MQELILQPNQSLVLSPGEGIGAGDEPLRIRYGEVNTADPNASANHEQMFWDTTKRQHGMRTAIYRRGTESRLVYAVPEMATPDSFGDEYTLTTTSRVFKLGKAELEGWLPQSGDTLEYGGKTYIVKKTGASNTFYQDVGNFGVMIRIFVTEYRS